MGWGHAHFFLLIALAALLLSAGIEDVRCREIANWKNAAIAVLAPVWWWASDLAPWPDIVLQIVVATAVFGLFVGAFAMNWMGGGDVKMIGALALWLPAGSLMGLLMVMSIAGGAVTLALMVERLWRHRAAAASPPPLPIEVPYGVAIAIAGLLVLPTMAPTTGF